MEPYDTFFKIFLGCYNRCTDIGVDILSKFVSEHGELDQKDTTETKFPVCPWCGNEQKNYEDFYFPDNQVLCCKKDTDKQFRIIRHKENLKYTTTKIPM